MSTIQLIIGIALITLGLFVIAVSVIGTFCPAGTETMLVFTYSAKILTPFKNAGGGAIAPPPFNISPELNNFRFGNRFLCSCQQPEQPV